MVDPAQLTADLIRCASVTPVEGGALTLLENRLSSYGFACTRVDRGAVSNLFARWGTGNTFGFNGHTDVVPVGDFAAWTVDPFGAEIRDGFMYGRGATDMKSAVAAFAAAAMDFVSETPPDGSIVLAITGDEEGSAKDGTMALLDWMQANNENMDVCLVGEPTCPDVMGQMMKIGRRGSMNAFFTITGQQGHSAYPHRANNPLPAMARLVDQLSSSELDHGTEHFDASSLAVVTIDTGNTATNVIPAQTRTTINLRFNDTHSGASLTSWLQTHADAIATAFGVDVSLETSISGESFITPPGALSDLVARAVQVETDRTPEMSTSGGTSDARFVQHHCPVVEFGLVGKTMHQVDECVEIIQIHQLKSIYTRILRDYFN
ncbi:MAG: succinyl-diaminopimelate desuccinylase [Planktomarina sp.]|jgi:succinyl-diaminopimelate desuccinylase|nr:succinyl-diaminopimelate desuccinylase [Planktomarina sp.]MDT2056349.1 succinyl-diaminopimelate desuccinylase [Planktomarina sp.]MDT2071886.1 succinyl-diaminopimelate desuccinylase [Planktomarina sp.]MDT2077957.1 succinyl-diaminopimelate desuccinylase [Planktomarina sp.]|tara:strand:+ start:235 stop:1365 length:1131 start_codon:yes stop_codon:yes gene_type:complete